ncbi:MAG: 50S ribosomal protein L29 [Anaerolineaceae bacterium]|nr:50S ribosomal protein L29 [Anaerolineaceae bacterium]MBN2676544.1 50S ribosomal protein L29 [Anaerolineaceae bacterium]
MKKEDLRIHSIEELQNKLTDARSELMNLRFQMIAGQLTDHTRLKITRRQIARLETILREKQLAFPEGEA